MGNWSIVIKGIGCHHNSSPTDADRLAAEFVKQLRKAGQNVTGATITFGAENDLSAPNIHIDNWTPEAERAPRCNSPVYDSEGKMGLCRLVDNHEGQCCPPFRNE